MTTTATARPARPASGPIADPSSTALRGPGRLRRFVGSLEDASPLLKQLPLTALFAGALALCFAKNPIAVTDFTTVIISGGIVAAATLLSVVFTARVELARLGNIVAAADFIAVAALRHGTGDARSIFGVLVLIPTLWMASNIQRRYVAYTSGGVALSFIVPLFEPGALQEDPNGVWRGVYVMLAYGIAAIIINELARQARRQFDVTRAQEQLFQHEIERGAEVQQALLPKTGSPLHGYEVGGACLPAALVGGDFYDWYPTADGMGFTLGDVMGKGVGAGMIAATARAVIRSARDEPSPVAALVRTDACLSTELGEMHSFATIFHARLSAADGRVRYSDAGHGLTLHVRADGGWERLPSSGLPLGIGLAEGWDEHDLVLAEGDLLVSFSDGVLDFYDGSLTALDHLALIACGARSADDLVRAVAELAARTDQDDDVTVIVVRRSAELAFSI